MDQPNEKLDLAIEEMMDSLPFVWDSIRSTLRASAISNFGITLEQFHTLRHIRMGFDSVVELSEKRQISRPGISQAVDVLVKKGLVSRQPDADDRRSVHLELTAYAKEVLDSNKKNTRAWMKEQMASLSEVELTQIIQALKTLHQTFSEIESQDQNHS